MPYINVSTSAKIKDKTFYLKNDIKKDFFAA